MANDLKSIADKALSLALLIADAPKDERDKLPLGLLVKADEIAALHREVE